MTSPSVLIVGASGALGQPLLDEFVRQKSKFNRIAVLARPGKEQKFADAQTKGIDVVVGSILDVNSYKGFDVVISVVGNSIMRLQPAIAELAIEAGVQHFYPSEYGFDYMQDGPFQSRYFRDKIVTRDHLVAKAKENPNFRYTYVITGAFTEWAASDFTHVDVEKHTSNTYGRPDGKQSVTSILDVVRYIVESILIPHPPNQAGREIRVSSNTITHKELIDALEEVQGVKYKRNYRDLADAAAEIEKARKRGDELSEISWASKFLPASDFGVVLPLLDNDKFSFVPEDYKATLRRIHGSN